MSKPPIVLRYNSCVTNDPCAICGDRCDPEGALDLVLAGTGGLVCDGCARRYAPGLLPFVGREPANVRYFFDTEFGTVADLAALVWARRGLHT